MANNPVQIVLNSQKYVQRVIPTPGGKNTDFYAGRDEDFIAHKSRITGQIENLIETANFKDSPLVYAYVELQEAAWAKSHRPVRSLFPSDKIRVLGANELGSIVVEIAATDIARIQSKILDAEEETNWVINKHNKKEARPSRARSEVGAIKEIRPYSASERRKFSVEQASKWLQDPRTGGAYYVETFASELLNENEVPKNRLQLIHSLYAKFKNGLKNLGLPIEVSTTRSDLFPYPLLVIKFVQDSTNISNHKKLISFLDKHAAVKSILLPPVLQSSDMSATKAGKAYIPPPVPNQSYPVIGIIDTGVSQLPDINAWQVGSVDFLDPTSNQDTDHGTFIAGLLCAGSSLNAPNLLNEQNCKYYDLGLHPTSDALYESYYPRGFLDFLEQLDSEISEATNFGVRIFNMSLSVTLPVDDNSYSLFANVLDQISDKHDVLFVLPAGNLDSKIFHKAWADEPNECLKQLAEYRHQGQDRVFQPADSLRAIAVGALEPPCSKGNIKPAIYTRRGPGPSLGAKPDLAHIGGGITAGTGLKSVTASGDLAENRGTSFAAPLVAKTLASLEHAIEGLVTRETLTALLLHNSRLPGFLQHKKLSNVAKDFVGAGIPTDASESLIVGDNEITLVFTGILLPGHELIFDFTWPSALATSTGNCRGQVQLTTVYRAPINREFGAEYVLTNVDTWLRQEVVDEATGEAKFNNMLKSKSDKSIEKERITHGAKWWPVKRSDTTFQGVGKSSQWRLVLESLCRSGYSLDEEGIPFCTILTISDPTGKEHIFNEMRQQLQASGANISDIRTSIQSRLRPGSR